MNKYTFYKYRAEQLFIYHCFHKLCNDVKELPFMKSQDLEWKHKEYLEELMNLCFDLVYFDLREYERFSYYIPELPKRLVPSSSIYMWGELIDDGLEITGTVWQPLLIAHFILHCYMEVQHGDNSRRFPYDS